MNLVRKYKISQITNEPLTGSDQEIIDFIHDKLTGLISFKHEDHTDSIFFMKDGEVLLEQDSKIDTLWCDYGGLCGVLINKYDMTYDETQSIIKYMVEQAFKIKVGTLGYTW